MIVPEQIFNNYNNDNLKQYIKILKEKNKSEKLNNLVLELFNFLINERPSYTIENLKNITNFFIDIPLESYFVFIDEADKLERSNCKILWWNNDINKYSPEFRYLSEIHKVMCEELKDTYGKKFIENIIDISESYKLYNKIKEKGNKN